MPTTTINGANILSEYRDEMIQFMFSKGTNPVLAELSVDQLWERWTSALMKERKVGRDYAERCLTEALVFLQGRRTESGTAPGIVADIGWHLMLHHDTRAYAAVCEVLAGRYVHHLPNDVAGFNASSKDKCNDTNDGGSTSKCFCS
jgi:hypothetical protein